MRIRETELIDVREVRSAKTDWSIRSSTASEVVLRGYASTFEPYEMYGGPEAGGWIEQIDPQAFDKTLRSKPDLHLLINHEGMPLARTKSGTLVLSVDNHGLAVEATLDRADPDVQRLETKMARGDMDEMSFAFRVKAQKWSTAAGFTEPDSLRMITEVSLHKGDVSVVNFGANPTTTAEITGRRRKKSKTLSRAEGLAIILADERKRRTSAGKVITQAEAQAIIRADEQKRQASLDIQRRTDELLGRPDSCTLVEIEQQRRADADARLAEKRTAIDVVAALGRDTYRLRKDYQAAVEAEQRRRAAAEVELRRFADQARIAELLGNGQRSIELR